MNKRAKIEGRLKALFPKANFSTKRMDVITAKLESKVSDDADDAAIDEIVNQANDFMDFEAIAKEDDRVRTLEANQKKGEEGKVEGTEPDPDKNLNPNPENETNTLLKTLLGKVEALEKGEVSKSKAKTVADLFSKSEILKGLPENQKQSWLKRVNLESDDLAAEVAALETEYTELRQSFADTSDLAGGPINQSLGKGEVTVDDIKAIYEN